MDSSNEEFKECIVGMLESAEIWIDINKFSTG